MQSLGKAVPPADAKHVKARQAALQNTGTRQRTGMHGVKGVGERDASAEGRRVIMTDDEEPEARLQAARNLY